MYINNTTQEQKTYNELKVLYPDTSLPRDTTPVILTDWYYVVPTSRPSYDRYTEELEQGTPSKTGDVYHQVWNIVALEASKIAAILLSAKENKYNDIWAEANIRNELAEYQFNTDANTGLGNTNRNAKQWTKISNKKAKSQTLSAAEKKFDDDYDSMLDWQVSTNDVADQAEDTVEAMSHTVDVNAYDVVTTPSWQAPFVLP